MLKKCNKCGFQQDEFLNIAGKKYCKNCNSVINVNSNQMSAQDQKTAHQLKLALGNLRLMLEPLEGFIEKAYIDRYPDFRNKRQLYGKTITGDYPLENFEETFLTQLLIMAGVCKGEPEFFRNEIKKEYYKWISAVGIDYNNCPDKLKHFLFEINEVLEDRGEKILEEKEAKIKDVKFDPKDAVGLFRDLQNPLNKNREERENYKGKNWNELGDENRFNISDEQGERGREAFQQIHREIAPKQGSFSFYPPQQRTNSEIIQDVKNNPQNWRVDEVITEYDNRGEATKKELALIHNSAQVSYDGAVSDSQQPVYLAQRFSSEEIRQINQAKGISQSTSQQGQNYHQKFLKVDSESDQKLNKSSKDDNSTFGIIAIIGAVSAFAIAGIVLVKKHLNKKVKK